ncbi:hypothetical protein [Nocardia tengchongensis]|nr:hypothetical protein [Nocardia tengchongensis]
MTETITRTHAIAPGLRDHVAALDALLAEIDGPVAVGAEAAR